MLLDIVDVLRCPAGHEESWLVASAEAWAGRHVVAGVLGCPVCLAQYPIRDGIADFTRGTPPSDRSRTAPPRQASGPDSDGALRLAAQLDLREPGGIVLLSGAYGRHADALLELVSVRLVVLNPPSPRGTDAASVLRLGNAVPFAAASVRGAAFDPAALSAESLGGMVRALRTGGRIVAPARTTVPAGVREIARDDDEWVGESTAPASAPVPLTRRGG